jgi:hypothetical protein
MRRYLPLLALAALGGCLSYECTLIGCSDSLAVTFTTVPTAPFHLDVRSAAGGSLFVYDCPDITQCNPSPVLHGALPESAVFTVTYQGRTTSTTARPEYTQSNPNGRGCGPTCTEGRVSLALP